MTSTNQAIETHGEADDILGRLELIGSKHGTSVTREDDIARPIQ